MRTRVPKSVTPLIRRLCRRASSGQAPRYLNVRADPDAVPNECFNNVRRLCLRRGGSVQHGWAIWEWPGVLVEAEFHAVWRPPAADTLIDISPRPLGVRRILFLPDPTRVYRGRTLNNIRLPVRNDPLLREYVSLMDELFELHIQAHSPDASAGGASQFVKRKILLLVRRMAIIEDSLGIRAVRSA